MKKLKIFVKMMAIKKKLKNKEIKNSLSENNDVISENNPKTDSDKIILLKNFKKEKNF